MGRLEGLQLAHQGVVLGVAHARVVEHVVAIVVVADLGAQLLNPLRGALPGAHANAPIGQMVLVGGCGTGTSGILCNRKEKIMLFPSPDSLPSFTRGPPVKAGGLRVSSASSIELMCSIVHPVLVRVEQIGRGPPVVVEMAPLDLLEAGVA